jgi:hypothetical protein
MMQCYTSNASVYQSSQVEGQLILAHVRDSDQAVFESTLRACARPWINIAHSGRENSFATHSVQERSYGGHHGNDRV